MTILTSPDTPIPHINGILTHVLSICVNIIVFYGLVRSKQKKKNKLKIIVLWLILFGFGSATSWLIYDIYLYLLVVASPNRSTASLIFRVTTITGDVSQIGYLILVGYFMKVRYEETYSHQYFRINKLFINICFIIYAIFTFIPEILDILVAGLGLLQLVNYEIAAWTVLSIISTIYNLLIITLFHLKSHRFAALTMTNDQKLSQHANKRLNNFVAKQTRLIIIAMSILFYSVTHAVWAWYKFDNTLLSLIWHWAYFISNSLVIICTYLTYSSKYTPLSWFQYCCNWSQRIQYKQVKKYGTTDKNVADILGNNTNQHQCSGDTDCKMVKSICMLLKKYGDDKDNILEYMNSENYSLSHVMNDFNHLLLYHDTDEQFNQIYDELNIYNQHDTYTNCKIYSRHFSRRRRRHNNDLAKETTMSQNVTASILDKIHSFYYHSYDTFLREKCSMLSVEDERKKMKIKDNVECDENNKFNTDLDINNEVNDIYSFGQRFEYDEEKNDWYITPKYDDFKDELLNNQICSISTDIYYSEYNKCTVFMKSKLVKKTMQKALFNHILSLLIYCNCDEYQNKWSATFRKISNDEDDDLLKQRHSHFYHCSKYLRDLVENFGSCLINKDNANKVLYHGVSEVLYFYRTMTQFNAPLSTSTEINVALRFSNNCGIILALKYSFSTYPFYAKYFDCAYFSDYVNEKEVLFIGGIPTMIIMNIINVCNGEIYKKYINALNIINAILNGKYDPHKNDYIINDAAIDLCLSLLSHQSTINNDTEYPQYVVELLNKYCINLTNITIFWKYIENIKQLKHFFCSDDSLQFFDLRMILNLFPNIEQIEYFNESFQDNKLFSNVEIKNIIKYIVEYKHDDNNNNNLKYIVIHHEISKFKLNCEYFKSNNQWTMYQDHDKIILHKQLSCELDINSINLRFNEIIQGDITQNMLQQISLSTDH